jgi:hypothetical protein
MHKIIVYIELHWAIKRPNLEFYLNDYRLTTSECKIVETLPFQENVEFHLSAESLNLNNVFQMIMRDKTDSDITVINGNIIDHWVKIRELEIDNIKCQTALYKCCRFEHMMPPEWVDAMTKQGYQIEPCYLNATDIRLNGTWTIEFDAPVWQWYCKNYE